MQKFKIKSYLKILRPKNRINIKNLVFRDEHNIKIFYVYNKHLVSFFNNVY